MKILCLRGSVPPKHEHPEKLLYNNIEECEDMWTQLWHAMCKYLKAEGELWYDKSDHPNVITIENGIHERWTSNFKLLNYDPDIIFARGGFPSYVPVLKKYPNAIKIYYGAGRRFVPQDDVKYDLVIADSPKQVKTLRSRGYNSSFFVKPAALLFKPVECKKKFDVLFVGNGSHAHLKGHRYMLKTFAGTDYKILNIGSKDPKMVKLAKELKVDITWAGWHLRKDLPKLMCQCRCALVCTTEVDSCPRVIPEALACGIPLIVTSNVNFWKEKYINETGCIVRKTKEDVLGAVEFVQRFKSEDIRKYYEDNLSLKKAASHILNLRKG